MQKARRHPTKGAPTDCKHTVSGTISLPSTGYFSPFPHGTGSLSVTREYLALGSGLPRFPQNFTCSVVLGSTPKIVCISRTGLSPAMASLSRRVLLYSDFVMACPTTPNFPKKTRFGLFPFRSPLLRESQLLSFPGGTEMVHFPPFALPCLYIQQGVTPHYRRRVAPFGNPRV